MTKIICRSPQGGPEERKYAIVEDVIRLQSVLRIARAALVDEKDYGERQVLIDIVAVMSGAEDTLDDVIDQLCSE